MGRVIASAPPCLSTPTRPEPQLFINICSRTYTESCGNFSIHVIYILPQKDTKSMVKQSVIKFSQPDNNESRDHAATYIYDLLQELEQIAERERIEPLDQFLKIARKEAGRISANA